MMHFIAKGGGYVAVFSAPSPEAATAIILELFRAAGKPVVEMEVMEFDPSQEGGLLLEVEA